MKRSTVYDEHRKNHVIFAQEKTYCSGVSDTGMARTGITPKKDTRDANRNNPAIPNHWKIGE
jgi:hypothetical protein